MPKVSKPTEIKVRVAPSPTGNLHVGTAQSALYNYLFARKNGGEFHVRVEDTDEERSTKEFENNVLEGFKWLGLDFDGPVTRSSDNKSKYRKYLEQLLNSGKAFWCGHSKQELEAEQKEQIAKKEAPRHICSHKKDNLSSGQVIRLNVDENSDREIGFDDLIRGKVAFKQSLLGDFSIARNLDSALYHLTVVIDDIELGTSHVIRGEDHISNTPKHILIYEALGRAHPAYAHLPLLLGTDRSKLSKRNGQTSIDEYKKDYRPDALINFLAILSHTYSKEILTRAEMIEEFDLKKVHKSGAVFDIKKLSWLNSQYIKRLTPQDLRQATGISEITDPSAELIKERIEKLSEAEEFKYLWQKPEYKKELLQWKGFDFEKIRGSLQMAEKILEASNLDKEKIRNKLDQLGAELGDRGLVYWPLRVALSGKEKSPDPVEITAVLGKEEVLDRINGALDKI